MTEAIVLTLNSHGPISLYGVSLHHTDSVSETDWNASYFVPVFADIKYSFMKTLASPFVSLRGGAIADITNLGVRTFASPAVGLDIARFSLKVGYEYQLGFWGHLDGKHMHNVKLGVAYTF